MKILVANPNTSKIVTDVIMRPARRFTLPSAEFIEPTSPGGVSRDERVNRGIHAKFLFLSKFYFFDSAGFLLENSPKVR
jgi:hypothetical protein